MFRGLFAILRDIVTQRHYRHEVKTSAVHNTGQIIMFSVITNIYNKKTKGPTLLELFTATGKLKKFFFDN